MFCRRVKDSASPLATAGRDATSLGFPEAQYRDGPLESEELQDALERALAGAAEIWAPAGIGGHAEHVQTRDRALNLSLNGGPPLKLYADLPYAVKYGWPGWVRAEDDDPHLVVEAWWRRFLPADLDLLAAKHALSPAEVRRKLEALSAYRTQLPGLGGGPLQLLRQPSIISYEVSWSLPAGAR
jgi:hypothetical protein